MCILRPASFEYAEKEWLYITALPADENGFTNPYAGVSREEFMKSSLPEMIDASHGLNLRPGFVPETDYFLWDGDEIVGLFRLRHFLNDALRNGSGHIGYGVRAGCRGKGYATIGLKKLIEESRGIVPEDELYLDVNRNNPASVRVQLKNGGVIVGADQDHFYIRIPFKAESPERNYQFRKAADTDKEAVLSLYTSAIGSPGCTWNEYYPSMTEIEEDMHSENLYVMTAGNFLLGAASIVPVYELDHLDLWNDRNASAAEIARVVVHPDVRRMGFGRRLTGALLKETALRGHEWVRLLAAQCNPAAWHTYESLGFVRRGCVFMYENDYFVYEKRL